MKQKIERLLDVRPEEWLSLSLMWFLYFLILFGLYLGYFAREALFLKNIGADYLPVMYILNSIVLMIVTTIYSSLTTKVSLAKLNHGLIILLALATGMAYTGIAFGEDLFYIFLYTLVDVAWTLFLIMFWALASQMYDALAAKRIFTIIASGWTAAMVLSGLLTPLILRWYAIRNFLILWIFVLLAIFLVMRMIVSRFVPPTPLRKKNEDPATFSKTFYEITHSVYLTWLVAATILHWLVLYLIDFYTAKTAASTFTKAEDLAAFFAHMISVIGAVALLIQLLLAGRLIKQFGVAVVFILFPVLLAISTVPMMVQVTLATIVLTRMTEYSLGISIYDTTIQLLYNPIPEEWRTRVRTFIDGSVKPMAVITSGVVIAILSKWLPFGYFPFVFAAAVILFGLVALRIRREYGKLLVSNLQQNESKLDAMPPADREIESEHTGALIRDGLKSENEETVVFALDVLGLSGHDEYFSQVARLLQDERHGVRLAATRALAQVGHNQLLPGIRFILQDQPDSESLGEAIDTYAALLKNNARPEIKAFLHHTDEVVRLAACENVIRYTMAELLDTGLAVLKASLVSPHQKQKIKAVKIIGKYKVTVLLDELVRIFHNLEVSDSVQSVFKTCILDTFQFFFEERVADALFSSLEDDALSHQAFLSLKEICKHQPALILSRLSQSSPAQQRFLPFLLEDMDWEKTEGLFVQWLSDQALAGYAIHALLNRKRKGLSWVAGDSALDHFIHDVLKRLASLRYAVAYLQSADTEFDFSLIVSQCRSNEKVLKSNLFAALSLGYDTNKMDLIFNCLLSYDSKYRALGLETMENILPRPLAVQIIPLFEQLPLADIGDLAHKAYAVRFSRLDDIWSFLAPINDPWLNLSMIHALRTPSHTFFIKNLPLPLKTGEEIMLHMMDKVFFLKSISLFAELSVDELFRLAELAQEKKFSAHSVVFNEGEFGDSLYLIISGSVNICKTKEIPNEQKKQEIILATLKEKDCFGEMAILSGEPRSATVKANAPLTTLEIDKKNFSNYMRSRPQVSEAIIKVLIQRLRAASARN